MENKETRENFFFAIWGTLISVIYHLYLSIISIYCLYLSIYLSLYIYLPSIFVSLSIFVSSISFYLCIYLPIYYLYLATGISIIYIFLSVIYICLSIYPFYHLYLSIFLSACLNILEWVAFPFCRGSSQPRDWTQVSCIAGGFFTSWTISKAQEYWSG